MLIKKSLLALALSLGALVSTGAAAAGGAHLQAANIDVSNVASLQRGARNFVNYCSGCHSARYVRYNRLAQDLQLSEAQVTENLMFTGGRIHDTLQTALPAEDAKRWFGTAPPDLSLIARSRGADYLYTFLKSYYVDPSRPNGVNNLVLPGTAMPHVLWELQGERRPVYTKVQQHGHEAEVFKGWEQVTPGTMTPLQFDAAVGDLVGYLQWMAEPAQNTRIRIGVWVMMFLVMSLVFVWRLNASYWKDVK